MRKRNKLIVVVTVTVLLLAACGSSAGRKVDSGEIVVPEMSSEDLLVSSLEYLLQDGEDAPEEKEEPAEAGTPGEPDGDAAYQESQESGEDEGDQPEDRPEQEAVPKENEAVIYYSNAGSYDLKQEVIQIEEKTAEELLNALAKHNIVSLDTKVLSFEEETGSQGTVLRLDLSRALNEYLKTMSKEAECIILASVVNTFLENYDAREIFITVNGKTLTTEQASYAEAFRQCVPEDLLKEPETSEAEDGVQAEEDIQAEESVQSEEDIQEEEDVQEEKQERDGEEDGRDQ